MATTQLRVDGRFVPNNIEGILMVYNIDIPSLTQDKLSNPGLCASLGPLYGQSMLFAQPIEINEQQKLIKEFKDYVKPITQKVNNNHKQDTILISYLPESYRSILDENLDMPLNSMRYGDDDLKEFREIIEERLDTAKKEFKYWNDLVCGKVGNDPDRQDMGDASILSADKEQWSTFANRQYDLIENLNKALIRITHKTYGICRVTGKMIDKARLRAAPHATLSIEAKTKQN